MTGEAPARRRARRSPPARDGGPDPGLVFPNDALGMIASLLGEPERLVLSPYLLSAGAVALSVLTREGSSAIPPSRLPVLAVLHFRPGISQTELARHLGVERMTAGQKVKECLALGLVTRKRSDSDARRFALFLSAKGRKLLNAVARASAGQEAEIAAPLTHDERVTLVGLLGKLLRDRTEN